MVKCKNCDRPVLPSHKYKIVTGTVEHVNCQVPTEGAVYVTGDIVRVTHTLPDGSNETLTYTIESKGP